MQIKDKVIIVTGASKGIGEAIAKNLAEAGAKLVLAARSETELKKLSEELPGSIYVVADMTKEMDIDRLMNKAVDQFGRIDCLINNAGQGIYGAIENVKPDDYR